MFWLYWDNGKENGNYYLGFRVNNNNNSILGFRGFYTGNSPKSIYNPNSRESQNDMKLCLYIIVYECYIGFVGVIT